MIEIAGPDWRSTLGPGIQPAAVARPSSIAAKRAGAHIAHRGEARPHREPPRSSPPPSSRAPAPTPPRRDSRCRDRRSGGCGGRSGPAAAVPVSSIVRAPSGPATRPGEFETTTPSVATIVASPVRPVAGSSRRGAWSTTVSAAAGAAVASAKVETMVSTDDRMMSPRLCGGFARPHGPAQGGLTGEPQRRSSVCCGGVVVAGGAGERNAGGFDGAGIVGERDQHLWCIAQGEAIQPRRLGRAGGPAPRPIGGAVRRPRSADEREGGHPGRRDLAGRSEDPPRLLRHRS